VPTLTFWCVCQLWCNRKSCTSAWSCWKM